jgi:hypothetical protein
MHKVRSGKTKTNATAACVACSLDKQVHLAYIAFAQKGNLRTYRTFGADLMLDAGCMNPDCIFIQKPVSRIVWLMRLIMSYENHYAKRKFLSD